MGPFGAIVTNMLELKSASIKWRCPSSSSSSIQLSSAGQRPSPNGRPNIGRTHTRVQVNKGVRVRLLLLLAMLLDVDPQDEVAFLVHVVGGGDDTVLADREPYPDTCLTTILSQKSYSSSNFILTHFLTCHVGVFATGLCLPSFLLKISC